MNPIRSYLDFETLIVDIFEAYDISAKKNQRVNSHEVDIILEKSESDKVFVEVKTYRTKKIHISQIKRALQSLFLPLTHEPNSHGMLVVASYIEPKIKKTLEENYGITIWDRSSLFHLTENFPNLRGRLENFLIEKSEDSTEDIFENIQRTNDEFKIGEIWVLKPKNQIKPVIQENKLCQELKDIKSGRDEFKKFEEKCQEVLQYIFDNDLTTWHNQARTDDGLNQFDLICRIASIHDFWRTLASNFNTRYILFEFKNYKDPIKQGQVYTTEKYLFNKALRSVGFIIAKNGADENAHIAMKGALRKHGKLLICLTPDDLCEMLKRKDSGNDPNSYMAEKVDEFLIKLSR